MSTNLTTLQSFKAMTHFLEDYYNNTGSDTIASLLSDTSLLPDGHTADPAAWNDWMKAIKKREYVTCLQAFQAMTNFLDAYYKRTSCSSEDLKKILNSMRLKNGKIDNPYILKLWTSCIQEALA